MGLVRFWMVWSGAALALGCGPSVTVVDDTGAGTTTATGGSSASSGLEGTDQDSIADDTGPAPPTTSKVDILFVIDNSGSMGEEQGTLAANLASFTDVLDEVGADYRIGITSSDNGNPWCSGTTPEGGQLRASSCRSRASEFLFMGSTTVDAYAEACETVCKWDTIEIASTATQVDANIAPRPWVEGGPAGTNIADGICAAGQDCPDPPSPLEALQCLMPQGINGCGFEQQLESMYKALARSENDTESAFGFMRSDALFAVVVLTDEADCSHNGEQETIFLPDGDRTFWSLPDEGAPTSAVCWNAGVQCSGGSCSSKDVDALDSPTSADAAVMRPVSRYVDRLQDLEDAKQRDVLVALIAGVASDGSVIYQDSVDSGFQDDFGIGPGCTSDAGQAVPPVRMRELAEAFQVGGAQNRFSICESDFSAALRGIADELADQMGP